MLRSSIAKNNPKELDTQEICIETFDLSAQTEQKKLSEKVNLYEKNRKIGKFRKAIRCANCGTYLEIWKYRHMETADIKDKLHKANFCGDRLCPSCAVRASRKVAKRIKLITETSQMRDKAYLLMTLTIKNPQVKELKSTMKTLAIGFNRFFKYKEIQKAFKGFFRGFEFLGDKTKIELGEAHPHIHILVAVNKSYFTNRDYIKQDRIRELWKKALGVDYLPQVNIQRVKPKDQNKSIFEVAKYCTSPIPLSNMSQKYFEEFEKQIRNVRQYGLGGLFKKIKVNETDEIQDESWELIEKSIYYWDNEQYNKA